MLVCCSEPSPTKQANHQAISTLAFDAAEMVAAGIVAATAKKVQAASEPKARAELVQTCKKLIKDAKITIKGDLSKKLASLC